MVSLTEYQYYPPTDHLLRQLHELIVQELAFQQSSNKAHSNEGLVWHSGLTFLLSFETFYNIVKHFTLFGKKWLFAVWQ